MKNPLEYNFFQAFEKTQLSSQAFNENTRSNFGMNSDSVKCDIFSVILYISVNQYLKNNVDIAV